MFRGYGRTLDIVLLLVLLVLSVAVLAMFALPEPPEKPAPSQTTTLAASPTPPPSRTLGPLPTLRPSLTPSTTPSPTPSPTAVQVPEATTTPVPTAPPGSTATPLPLVAGGGLLPHNALFIRRHNDFAAPPATGLESLLELGVNVNGTQVRFDAIEPFASDSVPGPSLGSGLALRYGVTEIPWTQKRDPRATHYLEVALRSTSRPDSSDEAQSLAANFVFVIDTSGSMEGAKISGVLAGMRALFAAMRPQDTIGIIDFDVQARTVLPATQVSELTPAAFNTALGRLVAAGGTDLYLGLEAGIAEAANNADTAAISYVFLFSDGNPTDGITEWLQIRAAMVEAVRGTPIRISTFGFGADANGRELDALAGVTGGAYTPVSDPASLGANLAEDLGRREILVAKDIRLKLEIDPTVSLIHLYGHDQVAEPIARAAVDSGAEAGSTPSASIGTEEEGLQITVPDLAAGEAYWVVLEVAVPEALLAELGTAAVTYVDTATGEHVEDGLVLTLEDRPTSLRRHVIIQHAVGLWSSDVAFYTLDDLAQDDRETASARLAAHAASLAAAHDEWQRSWLDDDTVTMRRLSLLAESLATGRLGARAASDTLALLRYTLETFGRARSGFVPLAVGLVP